MPSTERNIETLVLAILADAPPSELLLRHHDEDDATVEDGPSRLVVRCDPPVPHIAGRSPAKLAPVMEAIVTAKILGCFGQMDAAAFDPWAAAVDALLWPASDTYPAAVITAASTSFPRGIVFDLSGQAARWTGSTETRTRERTFRVIFRP